MTQKIYLPILFLSTLLLTACQTPTPPPDTSADTFLHGRYAYVSYGNQLQIIDRQNPAQPRRVGQTNVNGLIFQTRVWDDWLILLTYGGYNPDTNADTASVIFMALTDPANPTILSELSLPFAPHTAVRRDNILYIAGYGGSAVVDASDPTQPRQIRTLDDNHYEDLLLVDDTLYGGTGNCNIRSGICGGELYVWDVSDPAQPFNPFMMQTSPHPIFNMQVQGDVLLTLGNGYTAVATDQIELYIQFHHDDLGPHDGLLHQQDNELIIVGGRQISLYDSQDPQQPRLLSQDTSAPMDTDFIDLARDGEHLYLISNYGLHIYRITPEKELQGIGFLDLTMP